MTPKEKAEDLVNKYYLELKEHSNNYDEHTAKQCALIAVDVTLNSLKACWDEAGALIQYKRFQEVKQEIEKL